jgi:hypothetical protein
MKGEQIMKTSRVFWKLTAVVVLVLTLGVLPVTNHNLITAPQQVSAGGDKAAKFISNLERNGFTVREGAMAQFPMDERCCPDGSGLPCSFFNQASKYMVPFVPKLPEQPLFPEYSWYPGDPERGLPPNPEWAGTWQLRPDEALVLVGTTPPPVRYFGLQSYLFFRYNPDMPPGLPCPPNCYPYQRLWNNFGDQTNQLTIHSAGTPNGQGGNPFNSLTIYIVTPDREIDARVREAARKAGYSPPIINTEAVPQSLLNLGVGPTDDSFNLLFRAAFGLTEEDAAALAEYKAHPPFRVFRVTPNTEPPEEAANPFPIPEFRRHGTGETEFYLLPAVEELRTAVLDAYDDDGLAAQEFNSDQTLCHYGLYGLEQKVDDIGPSIDSLYLHTVEDLGTLEPDEFFIAYGVNHQQTGKAMYMNVTMYGKTKQIAADQVSDADLLGSAADYLPAHPDVDMLYAYKFARDCGEEENCLEIPYGCPGMASDESAYIIWRNYLEAATKTGADRSEVILDRVIKFSPAP